MVSGIQCPLYCTSKVLKVHGLKCKLAHADKNKIRGIYNHAQYLEERKKMLQWYSDLLINITW